MARSRPVDDDEYEDDALQPKNTPAAKKPVVDDENLENEVDDDTQKKKMKYKGKKKGMLVGGGIVLLILFCGFGSFAGYWYFGSDSPKSAYASFSNDVNDGKWEAVYDRMDKASQDDMETNSIGDFPGKRGKDLFVAVMKDPFDSLIFTLMASGTVESEEITGDKATLKIKFDAAKMPGWFKIEKGKETGTLKMVKEGASGRSV